MPNMSQINLIGHLGRDAVVRYMADNKPVLDFSIAYSRKRKDKATTTWFNCQWFGSRGEKIAQYLTKGRAVFVTGELYEEEYTNKEGELKKKLRIDVTDVYLLGNSGGESAPESVGKTQSAKEYYGSEKKAAVPEDEPPF